MRKRSDKAIIAEYMKTLRFTLALSPLQYDAECLDALREIKQHLESLTADHIAAGMAHEEAARLSVAQFGDAKIVGRRLVREWMRTYNARLIRVQAKQAIIESVPLLLILTGSWLSHTGTGGWLWGANIDLSWKYGLGGGCFGAAVAWPDIMTPNAVSGKTRHEIGLWDTIKSAARALQRFPLFYSLFNGLFWTWMIIMDCVRRDDVGNAVSYCASLFLAYLITRGLTAASLRVWPRHVPGKTD